MKYYQFNRLVREIIPRLEGARVQKVFQPDEHCVQLELYTGAQTEYLTVRTRPSLVSLYLAPQRSGRKGEAASDLCMKLRSGLSGASCIRAIQTPDDRVLELAFSPSPGGYSIVIELFGVGGNLFLLDGKRRVAAVLDHKAAAARSQVPGSEYLPPPSPEKALSEKGDGKDPLEELMAGEGLTSYNDAAALWFERLAAEGGLEHARSGIRRELNRERKRLERTINGQRINIEQEKKAPWYRECGEILAANFRSLKRGLYQAKLPDFYAGKGGKLRTIPLDESLTPQQNVERYFKKSRKLENAAEFARKTLEQCLPALESVKAHLAALDRAESLEAIAEVAREAGFNPPETPGKLKKKKFQPRHQPYRKFIAADGSEILVGKGGADNDELTFNIARGKDLWLHVSGAAGSHVVITCRGNSEEINHEALLDAANLAVQYSSIKGEERADVDYTRRKHVSRPPRSAPGLVVMAERKTVRIKIDRARLERLHKTRPAT